KRSSPKRPRRIPRERGSRAGAAAFASCIAENGRCARTATWTSSSTSWQRAGRSRRFSESEAPPRTTRPCHPTTSMPYRLRSMRQSAGPMLHHPLSELAEERRAVFALEGSHSHRLAEAQIRSARRPELDHFCGAAFGDTAEPRLAIIAARDRARADDGARAQRTGARGVGNEVVKPVAHLGSGHETETLSIARYFEDRRQSAVRP